MNKIEIISFDVLKILKPRIVIKGNNNTNKDILIKLDDDFIKSEEIITLDRKYIENRNKGIKTKEFNIVINANFLSKKLVIFLGKEKILEKNINIIMRLMYYLKNLYKKIILVFNIIKKGIKVLFQNHFIISLAKLKSCFKILRKRDLNKSLDAVSYDLSNNDHYRKWLEQNENIVNYKKFKYNPLISIIIPVYNIKGNLLRECLDSILSQSYTNFEICIADDASTNLETIEVLKEYERKFSKIKVIYRKENGHISEASNSALKLAKGDFIGLVDNDDVLFKDALYYVVEKLNENRKIDLIYSDEDKLDENGKRCCPHFKSDFALDTLLSINYICHFTVIRRTLVNEIGGFRSEYNGSQDYDLFLRVIDKTTNICHIPKILYHWRMLPGSTSAKSNNKSYAYIAGKRALEDYFKRNNILASVDYIPENQTYRVDYLLEKEPKISIIIQNKEDSKLFKKCLSSIYEKTNYKNYEVIINNKSCDNKVFGICKEYKEKYTNFNFIDNHKNDYDFSIMNNNIVKKVKGDYIVFLDSNIEVTDGSWLTNMVGYASRKHTGCVGVKLLFSNRLIQHAGMLLGVNGISSNAYRYNFDNNFGYFDRLSTVYNWSSVTSACLMIKKEKFLEVKGYDEKINIAHSDVDLCLKLLEKGYSNVLLPYVKLIFHETTSKRNDNALLLANKLKEETDYLCDKWKEKILKDKYYNENLSYIYPFRLDKKD
ncbi:MAG: glycosyltransferase [Bacilli bacterium]|nr:glycosyltransferase [Bacilli bacterium]